MDAYITYDISVRHSEVKAEMKKRGYHDHWVSGEPKVTYYLPNTTLWKKDTELASSVKDLKDVITSLNSSRTFNQPEIRLERCISVSASPWSGIPGEAHKS